MNYYYKFIQTLAILSLLSCSVFSQNEEELPYISYFLLKKDAFVQTPGRREMKLFESPSSITVITRKEISIAPVYTIPELLQYVVNINGFTKTHTDMDVDIRMGAIDDSASILVLIDGQPVHIVVYDGMQWPTLPISMEDIDRIEIMSGPGSSIYGANALMGVVNIITMKVKDRKKHASVIVGDRGTKDYSIHVNPLCSDNAGISLTAGWKRTEEKGDAETPEAKMSAPNWEIKDWADIYYTTYRLDYNKGIFQFEGTGGYSTDKEGYNPSPGDFSADYSRKHTYYINNRLLWNIDEDNLSIWVGARDLWQHNDRYVDGEYLHKYIIKKSFALDSNFQYTLQRFSDQTIIFGCNLNSTAGSRDIVQPAPSPAYLYNETDTLLSVYAEDQFKIFDNNLLMTIGGRYDKWHSLDGQFTPRIASNYFFLDNMALFRLSASTSFKKPAYDEQYFYVEFPGGWFKGAKVPAVTATGNIIPATSIDPQLSKSYEAELRYNPSNYTSISLCYFWNEIKKIIGYSSFTDNGLYITIGNLAGSVQFHGLEMEIKTNVSPILSVFVNSAWEKGILKNQTDTDYEGVPEWKFNAGLFYEAPWFDMDLRGRYVGKIIYPEISSLPVDSYTTLDISLLRNFTNHWTGKLTAMNLLNNEHYEYPIYTQLVRKFLLNISYSF